MDKIEKIIYEKEMSIPDILEKTKMYGTFNNPIYDEKISGNKENESEKVATGNVKKTEENKEEIENEKIASELEQEYSKILESTRQHISTSTQSQSLENMKVPLEIKTKVKKSKKFFLLLRNNEGKVQTKELNISENDRASQLRKEKIEKEEKEKRELKARIVAYQKTVEQQGDKPLSDFNFE